MKKVYFLPIALFIWILLINLPSFGQCSTPPPGATLATAIDAGVLNACGASFSNTQNLSATSCFGNDYDQSLNSSQREGRPTDDIFYKFRLESPAEVTLSHCYTGLAFEGRDPDTYIHLLNAAGTQMVSNDDNGPSCNNGRSSIRLLLPIGIYYVVSELYNPNSACNLVTSISTTMPSPLTLSAASTTLTAGASTTLTAGGASSYFWSPAVGLNTTTGASVTATPTRTTTYTVTAVGQTGCVPAPASVTLVVNAQPLPPADAAADFNRNWAQEISYDGNGAVISESKQFADALGRPVQAQVKNLAAGQVLASQTVYNSGGQAALTTLPAPTNNQEFKFKDNFITAGGQPYSATNFEGANANNPTPVDYASPLRVYYSSQNTLEPATPSTYYPFSLAEAYEGPIGGLKRATGPGDEFRMGLGRESKSRDLPLLNELTHYLSLRASFVPTVAGASLTGQGLKSVSIDADGKESIAFTDKEGLTLATCLSGAQYAGQQVQTAINADAANTAGTPLYQDLHIPAAGPIMVTLQGTGSVRIIDLQTNQETTSTCPVKLLREPGFYRFLSLTGSQTVSYLARYGDFSYTYYDDARRPVASIAPKGVLLASNLVVNPSFEQDNAYTQVVTGWQTTGDAAAIYAEDYGGGYTGTYHGTHYRAGVSFAAYTYQIIQNLPTGLYTLRAWVKGGANQQQMEAKINGVAQVVAIPTLPGYQFANWSLVELPNLSVTNGQCEIGFRSAGSANQFVYFDQVEFTRQELPLPSTGSRVLNPSFELDNAEVQATSSWQTSGDSDADFVQTYGGGYTGSYHGTHYRANASFAVYTYQVVQNLPSGLYTLRAWVKGGANQQQMEARINGIVRTVPIPATSGGALGAWSMVEITNLNVSNGQCEIGFRSAGGPGQFIYYDQVELTRQESPLPFVTRNTYSGTGTLLATENMDEGRTEYVYAKDGRIRFSQSAQQRVDKRFSYSNYDQAGRVVESGEYQTPNPTPQNIVLGQFEAESAATNGARYSSVANASGGAVGALINLGQYVTFTVTVPRSGSYALDLRYSSGDVNTSRTMSLYLGETFVQQLSLRATGSWTAWATNTQTVSLVAGTNLIKLQVGAGDNGRADLDYLKVTDLTQGVVFESQVPKVTAYEAENAYAGSNNGINPPATNHAGYRGAGFIGNLTAGETFVQFSVNVPVAGRYPVHMRYAAGLSSQRSMPVYVNWTYVQHANFSPTGAWANWAMQTIELDLVAGNNLIRFQHDGRDFEGWINLDYLDIEDPRPAGSSVLYLVEDRSPSGGLDVARCAQRNQIWYDQPFTDSQLGGRTQEFVLGAVSKTSNGMSTTWYSYDDQGRVTRLVQETPTLGVKTVEYSYDFTGNVREVAYQKNQADAFYHHYQYDANQRLQTVATSPDGTSRTVQARYYYYLHGPLKRVELAGNLQAVDYTYTLQGWLKAINSANRRQDPGGDSPAVNGMYKDLFGLTLDYFQNDYRSAKLAPVTPSIAGASTPRYTGAVRSAVWSTPASPELRMSTYAYDAKSQLLQANYGQLNAANTFVPAANQALEEGALQYDPNGNLLRLRRRDLAGFATDDFSYQYATGTNKLSAVNNQSSQAVLDYDYDATGQMIRQRDEQGQRYFSYDVSGKVTGAYRDAARQQPVATFLYNDKGFRISKSSYNVTGVLTKTTLYALDAAGNVLSVYEQEPGKPLMRAEVPLYGSGRVGTLTHLEDGTDDARYELNDQLGNARVVFHKPVTNRYRATMEPAQATEEEQRFQNLATTRFRGPHWSPYYAAKLNGSTTPTAGPAMILHVEKGDTVTFSAMVLNVANGMGRPAGNPVSPYLIAGGLAAGSLAQPARAIENSKTQPTTGLAKVLSRLSAGIAIPLAGRTSGTNGTSGTGALPNTTLQYEFQADGASTPSQPVLVSLNTDNVWEKLRLGMRASSSGTLVMRTFNYVVSYDAYLDDIEVEHTGGLIVQEQHQYAFGAPQPGLSYTIGDKRYRHGYQGQFAEKDEETGFDSFELRMYNSRIGRWTATDPEGQFDSPYVGMSNNPVSDVDPDGGLAGGGPGKGLIKLKNINSGYMGAQSATSTASKILSAGNTASIGFRAVQDATRIKPYQQRINIPRQNSVSSIGLSQNSIFHPQHFSEYDRSAQLGVEIYNFIETGYALRTGVPSLISLFKNAKPALQLTKSTPALRAAYEAEVGGLASVVQKMRSAGNSPETIARHVHRLRRELGIKYKGMTPPDMLAEIYARNIEKYGDKLGPTVEWLRQRGKNWEDIIEGAARSGGKDINFNK